MSELISPASGDILLCDLLDLLRDAQEMFERACKNGDEVQQFLDITSQINSYIINFGSTGDTFSVDASLAILDRVGLPPQKACSIDDMNRISGEKITRQVGGIAVTGWLGKVSTVDASFAKGICLGFDAISEFGSVSTTKDWRLPQQRPAAKRLRLPVARINAITRNADHQLSEVE